MMIDLFIKKLQWCLNDIVYKAPEQLTPEFIVERYINHLQEGFPVRAPAPDAREKALEGEADVGVKIEELKQKWFYALGGAISREEFLWLCDRALSHPPAGVVAVDGDWDVSVQARATIHWRVPAEDRAEEILRQQAQVEMDALCSRLGQEFREQLKRDYDLRLAAAPQGTDYLGMKVMTDPSLPADTAELVSGKQRVTITGLAPAPDAREKARQLLLDCSQLLSMWPAYEFGHGSAERLIAEISRALDPAIGALSEQRTGGWISVKERLPEVGGTYIVGGRRTEAPDMFDQEYCAFIRTLDGATWMSHNDRPLRFPIQYWMTTPSAPEPGGKGSR